MPKGQLRTPEEPPDYDEETPKFCLHHLDSEYDVNNLDQEKQAAFAATLQKLCSLRWKQIITAPRHGNGAEFMPKSSIKARIPAKFQDVDRFLVLRYHAKRPMVGTRVKDVFHVLWIEREFNELYSHGS